MEGGGTTTDISWRGLTQFATEKVSLAPFMGKGGSGADGKGLTKYKTRIDLGRKVPMVRRVSRKRTDRPEKKRHKKRVSENWYSIKRGQRWIRTTEGVSQQIYSLPHLATLVFARFFVFTGAKIRTFSDMTASLANYFSIIFYSPWLSALYPPLYFQAQRSRTYSIPCKAWNYGVSW